MVYSWACNQCHKIIDLNWDLLCERSASLFSSILLLARLWASHHQSPRTISMFQASNTLHKLSKRHHTQIYMRRIKGISYNDKTYFKRYAHYNRITVETTQMPYNNAKRTHTHTETNERVLHSIFFIWNDIGPFNAFRLAASQQNSFDFGRKYNNKLANVWPDYEIERIIWVHWYKKKTTEKNIYNKCIFGIEKLSRSVTTFCLSFVFGLIYFSQKMNLLCA